MKNNKGITLIALIITIIIMLILVVVTIQIAADGGLFKRAYEASIKYDEAKDKELIGIAMADYQADIYSKGINANSSTLRNHLLNYDWCDDVKENGDNTVTVTTKDGKKYKIDVDGNIQEYNYTTISFLTTNGDSEMYNDKLIFNKTEYECKSLSINNGILDVVFEYDGQDYPYSLDVISGVYQFDCVDVRTIC